MSERSEGLAVWSAAWSCFHGVDFLGLRVFGVSECGRGLGVLGGVLELRSGLVRLFLVLLPLLLAVMRWLRLWDFRCRPF